MEDLLDDLDAESIDGQDSDDEDPSVDRNKSVLGNDEQSLVIPLQGRQTNPPPAKKQRRGRPAGSTSTKQKVTDYGIIAKVI